MQIRTSEHLTLQVLTAMQCTCNCQQVGTQAFRMQAEAGRCSCMAAPKVAHVGAAGACLEVNVYRYLVGSALQQLALVCCNKARPIRVTSTQYLLWVYSLSFNACTRLSCHVCMPAVTCLLFAPLRQYVCRAPTYSTSHMWCLPCSAFVAAPRLRAQMSCIESFGPKAECSHSRHHVASCALSECLLIDARRICGPCQPFALPVHLLCTTVGTTR